METHAAFDLVDEAPFGSGDLRVRRLRLRANDLTLLLLRDPSAPVVAYRTWLGIGSSVEEPRKSGLAHLFEHLLFKGTPRHPEGDFDALLEAAGASTNAQTWFDYTAYQEEVPAEALPLVIDLESDRFVNLTLSDEEVLAELEVVKNERRWAVDNDVDGTLEENLYKLAFRRHPYGTPTIGWMADLEALTPDDVRRFYRRYYAPERVTLVIVGDADESRLCEALAHTYGGIPRSGVPGAAVPPPERPIDTERRVELMQPCAADRLRIAWHGVALASDEHATMEVLSDILGGGVSSRLYRALVVDQAVASDVWCTLTPTRAPGLLEIGASLQRAHSAEEAISLIDETLGRVVADGVDAGDLEKAKNRLDARLNFGLRDFASRADALGLYETVGGDYRRLLRVGASYGQVTAGQCRTLAERLRPTARAVAIARPDPGLADDRASDEARSP